MRENVDATETGDEPAPTRCHSCGAARAAGARFCASCGAQFSVDGYAAFVDPLIGAVVGERYRIVARIGSGGMGAVYRVEHLQLGKVAAMKLLHGELTRDPQMVRRFSREARAVSRLTSPNTVSVFDFGRSGTFVFIVMELLSGMDLARLLHEQGPLPAWRVAGVVRQVAASLAEAHGKGIVHRDLKPQNLFVLDPHGGRDERIKVLDFGLAKAAEGRDDSLELTQAGVVMGTPHYMSPEQIREGDVDARSDIYSLAAVAFRLLTGRPLFEHATPLGVLHKHLNEPPRPPSSLRAELAPLDVVMARALAKRPADRFGTIETFAAAFASAAAGVDGDAAVVVETSVELRAALPADARLGTRAEFEEFERRLRLRRAFGGVVGVGAATALAGAVVWSLAGSAHAAYSREREPNDEIRSATPAAAGVVQGGVAPQRDSLVDVDTYHFPRPDAHAVFVAELVGVDGVDFVLRAVDDRGRVLAESDRGAGGVGERLDNVRVSGEGVYVSVWAMLVEAAEDRPSYELRARFRHPYDREETEPNDGSPQTFDGVAVGVLSGSGDVDRFALPDSSAEGEIVLRLTGVPRTDVALTVSDQAGTRLPRIDRAGIGEGEDATVTIAPHTFVGVPFVEVSATQADGGHLTYRLEVSPPGE